MRDSIVVPKVSFFIFFSPFSKGTEVTTKRVSQFVVVVHDDLPFQGEQPLWPMLTPFRWTVFRPLFPGYSNTQEAAPIRVAVSSGARRAACKRFRLRRTQF